MYVHKNLHIVTKITDRTPSSRTKGLIAPTSFATTALPRTCAAYSSVPSRCARSSASAAAGLLCGTMWPAPFTLA